MVCIACGGTGVSSKGGVCFPCKGIATSSLPIPLPFQSEDLEAIEDLGNRALVVWDMGLGKTLLALWWLLRNRRYIPAVVVCPAITKRQWQEAADALGISNVVLEGRTPRKLDKVDLIIVNYDILMPWLKKIKCLFPDTIILDEIQKTANYTIRTRKCRSLCREAECVLGLSGTPMLNRTLELFNGLNMIRPDVFDSKPAFEDEFAKWDYPYGHRKYAGAKNPKKLNRLLLDTCMIRRKKVDVLDQLPPKIRRVVPLDIRNRDEYSQAAGDFLGWLKEKKNRRMTEGASQLAKVGYLLRLAAKGKMKFAVEWIQELLEEEDKVVVFAHHRKALDALEKKLPESVRIDGRTSKRNRVKAKDRFIEDPSVRLLLGNSEAAGTGLDGLQRVCSNIVFVELPWQPGTVLQNEDRLWRIGAWKKVWCWYLVAYNTIEEHLCKVLRLKQKDFLSVIDGGDGDDLDVMSMLIKEMKPS